MVRPNPHGMGGEPPLTGPVRDIAAAVRDQAGPALTAGIGSASPQADPIVAAFTAHYACLLGRPDDAALSPLASARTRNLTGIDG